MTRRMKTVPVATTLALLVMAGACATASSGSGRGAPDTLTRERLIETRQGNLYDAIQSLRPRWLRARGTSSFSGSSEVQVFLNEAPYGTVSDLSSIPLDAVQDVRFIQASEAGSRYGTVAGSSGVLLVRTSS
ncbi:MAG: hypothetical protein U5R14_12780 [Gemmatimonadota bacterium]|nr:hypothetical protein [Gemmatimonadota bacterium]